MFTKLMVAVASTFGRVTEVLTIQEEGDEPQAPTEGESEAEEGPGWDPDHVGEARPREVASNLYVAPASAVRGAGGACRVVTPSDLPALCQICAKDPPTVPCQYCSIFACKWCAPDSVRVSCMLTLMRDANVEEQHPDGGFEDNDAILLEEDRTFLVAGMPRQISPETIEMEPERRDYTSAMHGAGVRPDLFSAVRGAEEGGARRKLRRCCCHGGRHGC